MRRRSIRGLIVFVIVAAPAIALIWTQVRPLYRASGEIRVRPIIPRLVFETDDNGPIPFYDSFVNTQIAIMRSPTVLARVLDQEEVKETRWYTESYSSKPEFLDDLTTPRLERLKQQMQVEHRENTEIVDVALLDPNARDATAIVNAVLEQYTRYVDDAVSKEDDLLYNQLLEKKTSLEDKIAGQEKLLERLAKQLGTTEPDELIPAKRLHLDALEEQLAQLQQRIAILEWEIEQARTHDANDTTLRTSVGAKQPPYHEDAEWRQFHYDVLRHEHQIEQNLHGPNHPDTVAAQADLDFAQKLLHLRESQLDETWQTRRQAGEAAALYCSDPNQPLYATEPESIQHQLARVRKEEESLLEELESQRKQLQSLFETAQLFEAESQHLEHARDLYDAVRRRLDEKNMERNVASPIEILTTAFAPSEPYRDRRILLTGIALGVALILAFVAALLSRRQRPTEPVMGQA